MFKTFTTTLIASVKMLLRNRTLLVSSLGLAVISIFIFGWLFSGTGNVKLVMGIANSDTSSLSSGLVQDLKNNPAITVKQGSEQDELAQLRAGQRDALIVMAPGFGSNYQQGNATIKVYYNQGNITTLAITRGAVEQIVTNLNQAATGVVPAVHLSEEAVSVHNLRQIDFVAPGMLGMMLMWANLAVGIVLVGWRQQGTMRRLAATPLPSGILISTQMLARLLLSIAQAAALLAIAIFVFKVQVIGSWLSLSVLVIVGSLAMLSIGFVIGSFTKKAEAAQTISTLISFPMMFLGGSYFSTAGAPDFLQPVIQALPLTHINDALRQVINNGASLASVQSDVYILLAWTIAGLLLASRAFRWS